VVDAQTHGRISPQPLKVASIWPFNAYSKVVTETGTGTSNCKAKTDQSTAVITRAIFMCPGEPVSRLDR